MLFLFVTHINKFDLVRAFLTLWHPSRDEPVAVVIQQWAPTCPNESCLSKGLAQALAIAS